MVETDIVIEKIANFWMHELMYIYLIRGLGLDTDRARSLAERLVEKTKGAFSDSTESLNSAAQGTHNFFFNFLFLSSSFPYFCDTLSQVLSITKT